MKNQITCLFLLLTLSCSVFLGSVPNVANAQSIPEVFVGVDIAYGDVDQVKQLADEVGSYTNLFILGCTAVTQDRLKLEEACQYLFDKGLFFIVYQEYPLDFTWGSVEKSSWLEKAKMRWGSHFLGIYYSDEVGGRQLDHISDWMVVKSADNYDEAGSKFNTRVSGSVDWFRSGYTGGSELSLFTSDYALYWFDYQAGYDVLFAQLGWNYSRQLNVGLCRGAAVAQDKEWGAIITWTYTQPPYIESGEELYNDLLIAYDNGAKYIAVFNSNKNYSDGILEQEHLDALKQFWQYIEQNPRKTTPINERTAYILPRNYAYGFRGPNDKIWGLWEADELSVPISVTLGNLLEQYTSKLDIIYEDVNQTNSSQKYSQIINWNNTFPNPSSPPTSQENSSNEGSPFEKPSIKLPAEILGTLFVLSAITSVLVIWVFLKKGSTKTQEIKHQ